MRLSTDHGRALEEIVDFTEFEAHDVLLEGTGSLILDRLNCVAYASPVRGRTSRPPTISAGLRHDLVAFTASQTAGDTTAPIYHTNVMLAIGTDWAVVCDEIITDDDERNAVLHRLTPTGQGGGHQITGEQVNGFAGNVLEVRNGRGERFIAMSAAAYAFTLKPNAPDPVLLARLVHAPIPTIEKLGAAPFAACWRKCSFPKVQD